MNTPEQIWIIYDECDGSHVFFSREAADETLAGWKLDAEFEHHDSVWGMIGPVGYELKGD